MFEIESKNPDEVKIVTKKTGVTFNVTEGTVEAGLPVGKITGPGEFEIGDVTVRALGVKPKGAEKTMTIYDAEVGGVHVGIIGDIEEGLDDLGMEDILCTSSVRAVREISPKLVVATGNVDGMVTELKLTARAEKKVKVKNIDALPTTLEVVVLN